MSGSPVACPGVLLVGVDPELAGWLADRFPAAELTAVAKAADGLAELERRGWSLVVLDDTLGPGPTAELATVAAGLPEPPPLLCCVDLYSVRTPPDWMRAAHGRVRALVHPVDREELAAHAGRLLDLAVHRDAPAATAEPSDALAGVFERYRSTITGQLDTLDRAAAALSGGRLDRELRIAAQREAHKLVGSAGTFGFAAASTVARELETLLNRPGLEAADGRGVTDLLAGLRGELAAALAGGGIDTDATADERPRLLIVEPDQAIASELTGLAEARGLAADVVAGPDAAAEAADRRRPDVLVVGADLGSGGLALLRRLHGRIPALIRTDGQAAADRAELARLGAQGFLTGGVSPRQLVDAATELLSRLDSATSTALVVDDDPTVLALVRAVFEPAGLRVVGVGDPLKFWETLQATGPDLVILDIDLPSVDGIQLCRVIRAEPRWAQLPVLFLTARTDADTVQRVYAAGADDFVTKPIVGPELVTRATNRLERVQLFRRLAETDGLTGAANRRRAEQALAQLERLAARYEQPLAVALLDLDEFKQVNDRYGHGAGDLVLKRLAGMLRRSFRGEDVVARWGGEEFLVGMYGMTRDDGVHRIAENLEALRGQTFRNSDGETFTTSFSAGVAELSIDGEDLSELYRAADEALYRAKAAGRSRVLPAGPAPDPDGVDVALVAPEGVDWAEPLSRALVMRGYRVRVAGSLGELAGVRPCVVTLDVPGAEPVVALTGRRLLALVGDRAEETGALAAGADATLVVADLPGTLLQKVRRALRAAGPDGPTGTRAARQYE